MTDAAVAAVAASALTALVSWFVARRRMSGSVKTTDADRLWAQNERLLGAYQEDNQHLRERIGKQDERIAVQDAKIWELTQRERDCEQRNFEMKSKMERLERMLRVDLGNPAANLNASDPEGGE